MSKKKKTSKKPSKQPKKKAGKKGNVYRELHGEMWLPKGEFRGELEEGER